jgi:acyl carrier protein
MNTQVRIERFLLDELLAGSGRESVGADEPLVSTGVIDSLGMLRLITFLEEELGTKIADGDVVAENFETIRKIAAFVDEKGAESGAQAG